MTKGQIISGDFMIGIAIFLLSMSFVIPAFTRLSEERQERQFFEEVETRLAFVADYVLKTEGAPRDWNQTNVLSIGLANADGRINKTKISRLLATNKDTAKNLLTLGGLEFNLSFYSGDYSLMTGVAMSPVAYLYVGDNTLFDAINNSGLVWDLYYGGGGAPQVGDARSVYQGTAQEAFNSMVGNASLYRTIIIESSGLTQAGIDVNALRNFVATGGILVFEGNAEVISSGFSMSSASLAGTGTVRDTGFIAASYGSTINFAAPLWYFFQNSGDSPLSVSAEHSSVPGAALMGSWQHGAGRIYYLTDADGTVDGNALINVVNVVGKKAEYATGLMSNTATTSRAVVIDTDLNSVATARMVVGK